MMEDGQSPDDSAKLAIAQREISPMQEVLNNQSQQIEKLSGLLNMLADRLKPVLRLLPDDGDNSVADRDTRGGSEFVVTVDRNTGTIQHFQAKVGRLLKDLEV